MLAIMNINVAIAQTIFATVPMFTLLIAYFYFKQKITLRAISGVIASLFGVALLVWQDELITKF
jgi:drug/metabolite transporter (DMT)-like permease